jgi:hypothetical protein
MQNLELIWSDDNETYQVINESGDVLMQGDLSECLLFIESN